MRDTKNDNTEPAFLAYVTCPDNATAQRIAEALVDRRYAACVNIVPGLQSIYRWQGAVETDTEFLLMIKTSESRLEAVQSCVETLHPDDLPELIAVAISAGSQRYLDWVIDETR